LKRFFGGSQLGHIRVDLVVLTQHVAVSDDFRGEIFDRRIGKIENSLPDNGWLAICAAVSRVTGLFCVILVVIVRTVGFNAEGKFSQWSSETGLLRIDAESSVAVIDPRMVLASNGARKWAGGARIAADLACFGEVLAFSESRLKWQQNSDNLFRR